LRNESAQQLIAGATAKAGGESVDGKLFSRAGVKT